VAKLNIIQVSQQFPTEEACIAYLEEVRWHGTPVCPYCKSDKTTPVAAEQRHHCNNCNTTFSVTVATIFHHTHLPLQKWFLAICLILNAKKGISSRQLSRDLEVNPKTGWYLAMRIRNAMRESDQRVLLQGVVEMDETYIGGKPRRGDGKVHKRGRGTSKHPIVGMVERGGKIRCEVPKNRDLTSRSLKAMIRRHIDTDGALLVTDEFTGYNGASSLLQHEVVNHSDWYVEGYKHTNTIESFWSLLKRGIVGQYHKVSLAYLPIYVEEFCYRHNNRGDEDLFSLTIHRAVGVE